MVKISKEIFITSLAGTCLGIGFLIKNKIAGEKYPIVAKSALRKVVIITGANSGIGEATARELLRRRARVVLACRDMYKCEQARIKMMYMSKNRNVKCLPCDLASQESIRNFVDLFNKEYKRLDILINNAGVMEVTRNSTVDGIETDFGVNYLGHFLLTNLLLDKLKNSASSRIINLLSISYKKGHIDQDDLNLVTNYEKNKAYNQSQVAIALFTKELSRRLDGSNVTVNAVYPGVVNTKLLRHTSFHKSIISSVMIKPILWVFIKNAKQGSQPVVYAALDPDLNGISGRLIEKFEHFDLLEEEDIKTSKWLWAVSAKWTKLPIVV